MQQGSWCGKVRAGKTLVLFSLQVKFLHMELASGSRQGYLVGAPKLPYGLPPCHNLSCMLRDMWKSGRPYLSCGV
jgi:hypothetical protein